MRRRDFIKLVASATTCWPLSVGAQEGSKVYNLGYLGLARIPSNIDALQTGLRELGYVDGKNLKIEYRFGGEHSETLDPQASELVHLAPDVIVTDGTPAALAAKRATKMIPIVMAAVGDPVRARIVASLAHPGGNITGVTLHASVLSSKRIEVFKEAVPGILRLAVLGNAANPYGQDMWEEMRSAAVALRIEPQLFAVQGVRELAGTFGTMKRTGADAVIVLADAMLTAANGQISTLAAKHRLPAMYDSREYVEAGGLMAYGPNIAEMARHSATLVGKILKGANPADLPIEQPTKFELVINLKTAKALDLDIPSSILIRADEVIE